MVHQKTLSAPKSLKIARKTKTWLTTPAPGPHKKEESITLTVLLRDYLKLADNRKEVKYILNNKTVLVDGRRVNDDRFPVGVFDIVSIQEIKKNYIILIDHEGRLFPKDLPEREANKKICKIKGKTVTRGGERQINLYDGRNIIIKKSDDKYKLGGTVVLNLDDGKIVGYFPLDKGSTAYITHGRHAGKTGGIVDVKKGQLNLASTTIVKTSDGELETLTKYIYVVGDNKPAYSVI